MYKLGEKVYFLTNELSTEFSMSRNPERCYYMREGVITNIPEDINHNYYTVQGLGTHYDDILRINNPRIRVITIGRQLYYKYKNESSYPTRFIEFIPKLEESLKGLIKNVGRL